MEDSSPFCYTGKPRLSQVRESTTLGGLYLVAVALQETGVQYSGPKIERVRRAVRLTRREIEVLSLIAQGFSSKETADVLFVSKRTVDFHLANIYDKLQVHNRIQAFRAATRLGLIPFEPPFRSG